jgi:tetratricopeptide (TPR) repeat protein
VVPDVANSLDDSETILDDRDAIGALVNDLHWQIDQLAPRGIKDNGGNPYNPAYYKRGLQNAIDRGDLAVVEYVRRYVYRAPSDGYKKLEAADSLDLACEALVADANRPYAHLFTDADRAAATKRLAPHIEAIERRKAASTARINERHAGLPDDLEQLQDLAAEATEPEDAIAINTAILQQAPEDAVAMNRLGRAYEAMGQLDQAKQTFQQAIDVDPDNTIAIGRLRDLVRSQRR